MEIFAHNRRGPMTLYWFISLISRHLEVPIPAMGTAENSYAFIVDSRWDITIYLRQKWIYLQGKLGKPLLKTKESSHRELLQNLLSFNLKRMAEFDEIICMDNASSQLLLRKQLDPRLLNDNTVLERFEDFLTNLEVLENLFFLKNSDKEKSVTLFPQGIRS